MRVGVCVFEREYLQTSKFSLTLNFNLSLIEALFSSKQAQKVQNFVQLKIKANRFRRFQEKIRLNRLQNIQ